MRRLPTLVSVLLAVGAVFLTEVPSTAPAISRPLAVAAQGDTPWTQPIALSGDVDFETWAPRMVVDSSDNLHVVWLAWTGSGQPARLAANTVYYSGNSSGAWSVPVDILVAHDGTTLGSLDLVCTTNGRLYLAWGSDGQTYLSSAPVVGAQDAKRWETRSLGSGLAARIAVSPSTGALYMSLCSDDWRALELVRSSDEGRSWTKLTQVWYTDNTASAIANEQLLVAPDGAVHALWVENTERRAWQGETVWHARTSADGSGLSVNQIMRSEASEDPTLGSPALTFAPYGEAFIIWNNGTGSKTGRFLATSADVGVSWSAPTSLFPGLSGQGGRSGIAHDSANTLHLATCADGTGFDYGVVRYARLLDTKWSDFVTLPVDGFRGEHPNLAVTGGNRLHLVFTHFEGTSASSFGRVSYSSLALESPATTPRPTLMPSTIPTSTPFPRPGVSPAPSDAPVHQVEPPAGAQASNSKGLLLAIVPAALLVVIVFLISLRSRIRER